jgi:hypothetical protein
LDHHGLHDEVRQFRIANKFLAIRIAKSPAPAENLNTQKYEQSMGLGGAYGQLRWALAWSHRELDRTGPHTGAGTIHQV